MRTAGQGPGRDTAYHYRETNQRIWILQQLEEQVQHRPVTLNFWIPAGFIKDKKMEFIK